MLKLSIKFQSSNDLIKLLAFAIFFLNQFSLFFFVSPTLQFHLWNFNCLSESYNVKYTVSSTSSKFVFYVPKKNFLGLKWNFSEKNGKKKEKPEVITAEYQNWFILICFSFLPFWRKPYGILPSASGFEIDWRVTRIAFHDIISITFFFETLIVDIISITNRSIIVRNLGILLYIVRTWTASFFGMMWKEIYGRCT